MNSEIILNQAFSGYNPLIFGFEKCKSLHSYGPAVREYWLLHFVVEGKGIYIENGKRHTVSKDDIFVISPFEETYYEADSFEPWSYIWMGFNMNESVPYKFNSPVIHCPAAKKIFEDAKNCKYLKGGKSAFLSSKLWELVSVLLENEKVDNNYINKALNFFANEYMNKITVAEISKRLNIDRSYFSSIFKSEMGVSPQKYLNNLRLNKAAELMTRYNQAPTIAAYSVGYQDIYAFSKIFKKKFGVSPREYIKENKKTTLD